MKDYDYADIEALIADARRMRSEVVGEYLSRGWNFLRRGFAAMVEKARHRQGPYLPA